MNKQLTTSAVEGFISFRDHQVWYRIVKPSQEESGKLPLLCLHGGPGVPHDYLKPLEALAHTGRRVIFYDQLGCGNSNRAESADLYSINLFKDKLVAIRSTLNGCSINLTMPFIVLHVIVQRQVV